MQQARRVPRDFCVPEEIPPRWGVAFATTRKGAPKPSVLSTGIAAGQRLLWPNERSQPQGIALTLTTIGVLPMTHHVECVALLTPGSAPG